MEEEELGPPPPSSLCVAEFMASALESLGHHAELRRLAIDLGIRVREGEANPWGLPTATDAPDEGVTIDDVASRAPALLQAFDPDLAFRHIPFNTIWSALFEEVFEQALSRHCVVGVGYNFGRLSGRTEQHRHVSRILPSQTHGSVVLADRAARGRLRTSCLNWDDLATAVRDVSGGFWIVGSANSLEFDYTLPFRKGTEVQ